MTGHLPRVNCWTCVDSGEAFVNGEWVATCPQCQREHVAEPHEGVGAEWVREATGVSDCNTCANTGEIITDWARYLEPHEGDTGGEAVAACPDCEGGGDG